MPYIEKERRESIVEQIFSFVLPKEIKTPGELNYAITVLCNEYLKKKGISYTNMNEVIGVLDCAKLEFYRRMTAPYEDKKIDENGDVYYDKS